MKMLGNGHAAAVADDDRYDQGCIQDIDDDVDAIAAVGGGGVVMVESDRNCANGPVDSSSNRSLQRWKA